MRCNLELLVHAVDEGPHDEIPHRIPALPGIAFCRGSRVNFNKYDHLLDLEAQVSRDDGSHEIARAHIFTRKVTSEEMPTYLRLMRDAITAATYSKGGQRIDVNSDEVVFCNGPTKVLPKYKFAFEVRFATKETDGTTTDYHVRIFYKKDPSEMI